MRHATMALALLAGCSNNAPTEPTVDPLYQAVCIDSIGRYPLYRCEPTDTVTISLRITLPNPNPTP